MTLVPVDGILEVVAKLADVDPDAADELVRLGLYEATCDQIDAMAPRLAADMAEFVAKRCSVGRAALTRMADEAVSKAETDSLARQLAYLDAIEANAAQLVSKGVLSWLGWNQQHPGQPKDKGGRWAKPNFQEGVYDVLQGVTGDETSARSLAYALPMTDEGRAVDQKANAQAWNAGPGRDRSYRRLSMTGQALRQATAPGSSGHAVGTLAQAVGELGPEAEKVLGPGIARTAYRYRGTEKRPDEELIGTSQVRDGEKVKIPGSVGRANNVLAKITGPDTAAADQEEARLRDANATASSGRRSTIDPVDSIVGYYAGSAGRRLTPDQKKLRARGDVLAEYLVRKLPSPEMTAISMKAGEVPPSQGVMLDADGEVVTEAQGFNGDHYLPFDLKNLRGLQGGQYVRTRATGGLTTEDIYTGLLAGARQVQVVSNSGVFTLEFDPALRGGRRYSDKARRMIGRYERLLDTIGHGELYRQDVPDDEKRKLKQDAYESQDWDPVEGEKVYQEDLKRRRQEGSFVKDKDELNDEAEDQLAEAEAHGRPFGSNQERARAKADILRELTDANHETAVRQYQLDGQGYAAAMAALVQEFPYYLRQPTFEPLPEFLDARGMPTGGRKRRAGPDKAYVEAGQVKATGLGTGFHSKTVRGSLYSRGEGAVSAVEDEREQRTETGPASTAAVRDIGSGVRPLVSSPIAKDTVPLDQVIARGSHASKELAAALRKSVYVLEHVGMGGGEEGPLSQSVSEEDALTETPMIYTRWKIAKFSKDSQGLADWLLHDATPAQREKFMDGVKQSPSQGETVLHDPVVAGLFNNVAALESNTKKAADIAGMAGAFAPSVAENPALASVSLDDPRPQPFPEILVFGDKPENYDKAMANMARQKPAVADAIREIEGLSDREIAEAISAETDRLKALPPNAPNYTQDEKKLLNVHYAWTFKKARALARGAAPFAPAAQAPQRSVRTATAKSAGLSPLQLALQEAGEALYGRP